MRKKNNLRKRRSIAKKLLNDFRKNLFGLNHKLKHFHNIFDGVEHIYDFFLVLSLWKHRNKIQELMVILEMAEFKKFDSIVLNLRRLRDKFIDVYRNDHIIRCDLEPGEQIEENNILVGNFSGHPFVSVSVLKSQNKDSKKYREISTAVAISIRLSSKLISKISKDITKEIGKLL